MKKHLSLIIISAMIASLLYGCGGGSSAGTANDAPAAETAETQQASEEQETAAAAEETAPAETEEETGTPTGYKYMGYTLYNSDGSIRTKVVTDMYGDALVYIYAFAEGGTYTVSLTDKETDGDGKWTGSTIYSVSDVKDPDLDDLDVYKTEDNIEGTERCTYNEDGFVVERYDLSGNVTNVNTYNDQGQLLLSQAMNQGEVRYEVAYTYDEQGIMSRVTYGAPGEGDKQFSEYLSIGAVPLEIKTGLEGSEQPFTEMELHFDANGVLTGGTEHHWNGQDPEPDESAEYTFELDENGNLIRDTCQYQEGEKTVREWNVLPIYE